MDSVFLFPWSSSIWGGELKFASEGDPLPLNIKPGVAWKFQFERFGTLALAMDSDLLVNDGLAFVQPGFEWRAHPAFALRGGYQIGRDEDAGSGLGVGAGFYLYSMSLDYAFVPFGDLGDTHRVSLGFMFSFKPKNQVTFVIAPPPSLWEDTKCRRAHPSYALKSTSLIRIIYPN